MILAHTTCDDACKPKVSRTPVDGFCSVLLLAIFAAVIGCDLNTGKNESAHTKPAVVEKLPLEIDLATVTLTPDAVARLGIESRPVELQQVAPRRLLGGEAVIPSGKSLAVTAPVTGIISPPNNGPIPLPGTRVEAGMQVLALVPLLSPERDVPTPAEQVQLLAARANLVAAQAVARGEVERSRAEVEAAKINLARAEKLFQDRAGPRKAVDDATAQLNIAQSVLQSASQRDQQLVEMLDALKAKIPEGEATPLPLSAPIGGIVNRLNVSAGQTVAGGAVLFEIVNLETIWIRVPVFVDLLPSIQTDQNARLLSLSGAALTDGADDRAADLAVEGRPIAAPPTANAMTSSADLYYEVDNRSLAIRPGQRIGVELPLTGASEALAVPASSILFDIHGNAWVYVVTGERQYTRHRVSIRWVEGEQAILAAGPAIGSPVVVVGAAELFGTEFGTGK